MDLLYSTRNYIQYLVINYNGKDLKKEYTHTHTHTHIYIYMYNRIICSTPETKTIL